MTSSSYALPLIESNGSTEAMVPHLVLAPPNGRALPRSLGEEAPTVFVAEDDPDIRLALGGLLADEGLRPVLFPTASMLLGALDCEVPALIVTDLVMPGMSGAQLLRAVRDDEQWRYIPVIVMAGIHDTASPLRLDAPLVNKSDTDSLLDIIRTLVP